MSGLNDFDYDKLLKEYQQKHIATEQTASILERAKAERQKLFAENAAVESSIIDRRHYNKALRDNLDQLRNTRKDLEQERKQLDQQISKLQRTAQEFDEKIKTKSDNFVQEMLLLKLKIRGLGQEFDKQRLLDEIKNNEQVEEDLKNQIKLAKGELLKIESVRPKINEEYMRLPGLNDLSAILREESVQNFGRPDVCRRTLAEVNKNIASLENKIAGYDQLVANMKNNLKKQ